MTSKTDRMGLRYPPMAFTEHGILMLSSVLNSERAIQVNIEIMRSFVDCERYLPQTRNYHEGWIVSKANMTANSRWSSTRFANSWPHDPRIGNKSASVDEVPASPNHHREIHLTIELLLRSFPLTANHLVHLADFVTSRPGQGLTK